jgi:tetratricopeptide (TPR) repeat protein
MTRSRHWLWAAVIVGSALSASRAARGDASVWREAAAPTLAGENDTVTRARRLHQRHLDALSERVTEDRAAGYLLEEAALLRRQGAAASRRAEVLHAYARVERSRFDVDKNPARLDSAVMALRRALEARGGLGTLRQAAIRFDLSVSLAHLERREEEILAEEKLLEIEPDDSARSLILANMADSLMSLGRLEDSIHAFQAALALLPSGAFTSGGVTSLWGLAVALDRSGDLPRALERVALARSYDPADMHLRSPSWFFVPTYEEHWYAALGSWHLARTHEKVEARRTSYEAAATSYRRYLAAAPSSDRWRELATARLVQCEAEARKLAPNRRARLVAPRSPR